MTMQVSEIFTSLFKRDSKGKTRIWYAETGSGEYNGKTGWAWRTTSGLIDGQRVTSEWSFVEEKNVGKSNATTLSEQAAAEVIAEYAKKRDRGYFENLTKIDTFDKIKPMLAEKFDDVTISWVHGVYSQPKLDGIRCIARMDGLWTRVGKEIVGVPHVSAELMKFFAKHPNVILDGELYNHDLKDDFNAITSMVRKAKPTPQDLAKSAELVQYHVYDAIVTDQPDMLFSDRELLRWEVYGPIVKIVPTMKLEDPSAINTLYEGYLEHGYEGQMIRINAPYQFKRSKNLLKRKEFLSDEFPVVEMLEGQGNWQGAAKHFVVKLNEDRNFQTGVRGTREALKALWDSQTPPSWVTIRYFTPTPDGIPRFPVVTDWGYGERED